MHWICGLTYLGGGCFGVDITVVNLVLAVHLEITPTMTRWPFRCSGLSDKKVDGEQLIPMSPKDEEEGRMLFRFVSSQVLLLRCMEKRCESWQFVSRPSLQEESLNSSNSLDFSNSSNFSSTRSCEYTPAPCGGHLPVVELPSAATYALGYIRRPHQLAT